MKRAIVIAVEGPDRVGKATQTRILRDRLRLSAKKVALCEVPIKGAFYDTIYWMLKNGSAKRFPNLFQLVQSLNKYWFQTFRLRTLVRECDYVILDRWKLSTQVYGICTGAKRWLLKIFDRLLIEPDATVILFGRPQVDEVRDVYEKDSDLQHRVKRRYILEGMLGDPDRVRLINANLSREEVASMIWSALKESNFID